MCAICIVSDHGPQFASCFWKESCRLLSATASLSSEFHPQSNGQTERCNQEIETSFRCFESQNPSLLSRQRYAQSMRTILSLFSQLVSSFQCVYGYQPPLFPELEEEVAVLSDHSLVCCCHLTQAGLLRSSDVYQRTANKQQTPAPCYRIGQRDLPLRVECHKLAPHFVGPFPITKVRSRAAVRLCLPPSMRVHVSFFNVSKVKTTSSSPLVPLPSPTPLPCMIEGGPAYTVNRLLDVQQWARGRQYLVDWKGYGPKEKSWVSSCDILDKSLLNEKKQCALLSSVYFLVYSSCV